MEEDSKSLSAWRLELKKLKKSHWLLFYKELIGVPVSSPPRLYKALNLYGDWALFEAIVATSTSAIVGDPLNYVLKVTSNKWKEMQLDEDSEDEYKQEIEAQKQATEEKNKDLEKRLNGRGK